jgi:hypothetical protein
MAISPELRKTADYSLLQPICQGQQVAKAVDNYG